MTLHNAVSASWELIGQQGRGTDQDGIFEDDTRRLREQVINNVLHFTHDIHTSQSTQSSQPTQVLSHG